MSNLYENHIIRTMCSDPKHRVIEEEIQHLTARLEEAEGLLREHCNSYHIFSTQEEKELRCKTEFFLNPREKGENS